jgi:hypothetical protein
MDLSQVGPTGPDQAGGSYDTIFAQAGYGSGRNKIMGPADISKMLDGLLIGVFTS